MSRRARAPLVALLLVLLGAGACTKEDETPTGGPGDGAGNDSMPRGGGGGDKNTMRDSGYDKPPEGAGGATGPEGVRLPPPAFRFEDATAASGITGMVTHPGRAGVKEYLVEAVGPGPAFLDYDNDGRLDLYVPDGDVLSNYELKQLPDAKDPSRRRPVLLARNPRKEVYRDRLYHNVGGGKFEDVTERAGVGDERWSFGALAFDYDGDGWTDLFVANFGKSRLWRNNGNGTFTDVAEAAGIAGSDLDWATCATCGDFDEDGRLDLYVARYADVAHEVNRQRETRRLPEDTPVEAIRGRSCKWRGIDAYCGPIGLKGQQDSLYQQVPGGTFRDVAQEFGAWPKSGKYGFTSFFFDYDGNGLLDVYVANDSEENFLWKQERTKDGKIRFRDVAEELSVKYGAQGQPQASMGALTADINQDGVLDMLVTNFSHDWNNIFIGARRPGGVTYKDRGLQLMGEAVFYDLSWGCGFHDFDQDADLDLLIANGHVYKEIDLFSRTGTAYDQWCAVFETLDPQGYTAEKKTVPPRYREVGPKMMEKPPKGLTYADLFAGKGLETRRAWRGATFGDYDNDGDIDVILTPMNDAPLVLRNELAPAENRRWVKLLPQMPGPNHDAIGATVLVTSTSTVDRAGEVSVQTVQQTIPVVRCQSFLGTDDFRIHAGVADAKTVDVTVTWPGIERKKTEYKGLATNAYYVLRPDGEAERKDLPK